MSRYTTAEGDTDIQPGERVRATVTAGPAARHGGAPATFVIEGAVTARSGPDPRHPEHPAGARITETTGETRFLYGYDLAANAERIHWQRT